MPFSIYKQSDKQQQYTHTHTERERETKTYSLVARMLSWNEKNEKTLMGSNTTISRRVKEVMLDSIFSVLYTHSWKTWQLKWPAPSDAVLFFWFYFTERERDEGSKIRSSSNNQEKAAMAKENRRCWDINRPTGSKKGGGGGFSLQQSKEHGFFFYSSSLRLPLSLSLSLFRKGGVSVSTNG